MRYAICIGENGRIRYCTYEQYASGDDMIVVNEVPEGDICDYRFVNGRYIYDPVQKTVESEYEEITTNGSAYQSIQERLDMLTECILELSELLYN